MDLPILYEALKPKERKAVREEYIRLQCGLCFYCQYALDNDPPASITDIKIKWEYFPPGFLLNPIHLQHSHESGLTEGAVHAYCNAVLWQIERR